MKIFVGGLAWATNDERLKEVFSEFGSISEAKVILDRETGKSRGFGFVTFENKDAGVMAIKEMDGQKVDGRSIRVNEAESKGRSGGGGNPNGPRRDDRREPEVSMMRRRSPSTDDGGYNAPKRGPKNRKSSHPSPEREFVERD